MTRTEFRTSVGKCKDVSVLFSSWSCNFFASVRAKHALNTVLASWAQAQIQEFMFLAHCNNASVRAILAYCLYQLVTWFCAISCSKFLSVLFHALFPTMRQSGCCNDIPTHLGVQDVIRVTQAGEWQKSKQMMGLPTPPLRPLSAFLQFILPRKTEGLAHLDCSFFFKQKFLAQRDFWRRNVSSKSFATYIAISTSFQLSPFPFSFSTTFW